MNISQAIKGISAEYAALDPMLHYAVLDDGDGHGPYLACWNNPLPVPTGDMLATGWANFTSLEYREKRRKEYPPIGDQLDAIWKVLAGYNMDSLHEDASSMLELILEVKAKYPKPMGVNDD